MQLSPSQSWTQLKDEELLKLRICDLGLKIEGSSIQGGIERLFADLQSRGLALKPTIYLGDEWFSPEGMLAIAVPFYLAHPRLVALEKSIMLDAEGEEPGYFLKLLRHEAGHCFDHGYKVSRRRKWRELFGSPDEEYAPETYRPRPYSRSYVKHLENWYAQAHPDEDFAETFAVWLDPDSDWKSEYKNWPVALEKLKYIDQLTREFGRKRPEGLKGYLPYSASRMKTTLEKYYAKRRKQHAEDYPDFYDSDLKHIFNGDASISKREFGAARFMTRNRKVLVDSLTVWTAERKFTINSLVKKLTTRCENLDLRLGKSEAQTYVDLSAYLATLVTHYLFTGKFKRSV